MAKSSFPHSLVLGCRPIFIYSQLSFLLLCFKKKEMRENRTDLYFLFITHSPMSYIYIHQHFVAAICLYSKLFPRRLHRIGTVISRNRIPELNFRLAHPYSLSLWISLFSLLALFPFNKDKKREREREEDYIEERDRESILYNRRAYSRIYRDEEGEWNAWRRP